jgi:hypothetical protein
VATALQPLDKNWFRIRYFAIDRKDYRLNFGEQDSEYTWDYFKGVRDFYQKAADGGRWVIFTRRSVKADWLTLSLTRIEDYSVNASLGG